MKSEKLYDGITEIREDLIEQAENYQFRKKRRGRTLIKWGTMAACLCLVVGIGTYLFRNMDGKTENGGLGGAESGTTFMSYEGPIMPLTALSDAAGVVAERNISFDFSPYQTTQESYENEEETVTYDHYQTESFVTDRYTLTNTTDEDIVLTTSYGFSGSFRDSVKYAPTVKVDGTEIDTQLYAGRYTGSFQSAYGSEDETDRSNLADLTNWESYQALLSDGAYMEDALAEYPELNQNVIVYELTNLVYEGTDETAVNPSLDFNFKMNPEKTVIMTYGSNGGSSDLESGEYHKMFDIKKKHKTSELAFLIALGEDISEINLQAYKEGMYEAGEELDDVTVDMQRYETTLGEMMWRILDASREAGVLRYGEEDILLNHISDEMLFGSIAELMYDYGVLSADAAERYEFGMLEDMEYESEVMKRILYLTFEVMIPANTSIQVDVEMMKDASFDYYGEGTDRNGFDMMTTLGSAFAYTGQSASITGTEYIEIVDQNFGFDVEHGVTSVELDLNEPHYYIEVRKLREE